MMRGLSCYTGSLAGYLAAEVDARAELAGSVRLAVRTDLPDGVLAFSHHDRPLDQRPDGTRLRYAGTAEAAEALAGLAAEVREHGRAIAVADNAKLPWSPLAGTGRSAPHWLLVGDHEPGKWHVSDSFAGLMDEGEQEPHTGWLTDVELLDAMTQAAPYTPVQAQRSIMAFGFPVAVPEPGLHWLRREADDATTADLPGSWLTGNRPVLDFLFDLLERDGVALAPHLDDVWTATQHRVFAYRWLAEHTTETDELIEAAQTWEKLPGALRFAVDSARRGRPRTSLVRTTIDTLLDLDDRVTRAVIRKDAS